MALFFFVAVGYGVIKIETFLNFGPMGKTINYTMALIPFISFLVTLFSDPGIYDE